MILPLENGHWVIGDKSQNVGGFKSVRTELDDVPTEGWLYNDGTKWNDNDTTITVRGEGGREGKKRIFYFFHISEGGSPYPEILTVFSRGGVSSIIIRQPTKQRERNTRGRNLNNPLMRVFNNFFNFLIFLTV